MSFLKEQLKGYGTLDVIKVIMAETEDVAYTDLVKLSAKCQDNPALAVQIVDALRSHTATAFYNKIKELSR